MNFGHTIKNFNDHVLMTVFIEFHLQEWLSGQLWNQTALWVKPVSETQIPHDLTDMWNIRNTINKQNNNKLRYMKQTDSCWREEGAGRMKGGEEINRRTFMHNLWTQTMGDWFREGVLSRGGERARKQEL